MLKQIPKTKPLSVGGSLGLISSSAPPPIPPPLPYFLHWSHFTTLLGLPRQTAKVAIDSKLEMLAGRGLEN